MQRFVFYFTGSCGSIAFGHLLGMGLMTHGLFAGSIYLTILVLGGITAFMFYYYSQLMQARYQGKGYYSVKDMIAQMIIVALFIASIINGATL